jgi:hypothetical protein
VAVGRLRPQVRSLRSHLERLAKLERVAAERRHPKPRRRMTIKLEPGEMLTIEINRGEGRGVDKPRSK